MASSRDIIVVIPREWSSGRRRRDATSDARREAGDFASLATAKGPDLQIALEERDVVKRFTVGSRSRQPRARTK